MDSDRQLGTCTVLSGFQQRSGFCDILVQSPFPGLPGFCLGVFNVGLLLSHLLVTRAFVSGPLCTFASCSLTGLQTLAESARYMVASPDLSLQSVLFMLAGPTVLLPWAHPPAVTPWGPLVFPKMSGRGCHGAAASALRHPPSKT